ncbi:hypothetical protein QDA02_gp73 [Microbacterium phage Margaery]|uniref:Minor tail protein n=1 Tax=Microbacterium phage Margaery TaxID=2591217 RepID=A0A514DHK9_9CAUD|nr:hypothetical protein QDA02_gp73 [Microbacterium phage Margaery]QDH93092.1 hypothetical protein PBI_MARGAERY_35 [Microbacterium phage Margaery]
MTIRTTEELLRSLLRRVGLLERRIAVRSVYRPVPVRGTTAERNERFGVPATDAERAALANEKPTWWNTDFGWEESYYAPTGLAGLTARGLVAGTAADWYPTGEGPYSRLLANAPQSMAANQYINTWSQWGTGGSTRRGGAAWFTYNAALGAVNCLKAGYYDITSMDSQQAGTGTTVTHILRSGNAIATLANVLNSAYATTALKEAPMVAMGANGAIACYSSVGSYQTNVITGNAETRGFFHIRYKGPLLVTD